MRPCALCALFFFFNDTATTEIYTLSLHDALPILPAGYLISTDRCDKMPLHPQMELALDGSSATRTEMGDRKSTRLNSSHGYISYAVFCLKKKKTNYETWHRLGLLRRPRSQPTTAG